MTLSFFNSFQSEFLKTKRSLVIWLIVIGAAFSPTIVTVIRLVYYEKLQAVYTDANFWVLHWRNSWESMAIFLLPLGVILATTLIIQLEYKNNTWKQLHTLPLSFPVIFLSKLAVIIFLMLQFFVLFNIGVYFSAIIPWLFVSDVSYPTAPFPHVTFLNENLMYFIDCLPIIALQYLLSLKYKNFLVSIGLGFLIWLSALVTLSWKYCYIIPYSYCMLFFLKESAGSKSAGLDFNIHLLALAYFTAITVVNYILYVTSKEKG